MSDFDAHTHSELGSEFSPLMDDIFTLPLPDAYDAHTTHAHSSALAHMPTLSDAAAMPLSLSGAGTHQNGSQPLRESQALQLQQILLSHPYVYLSTLLPILSWHHTHLIFAFTRLFPKLLSSISP